MVRNSSIAKERSYSSKVISLGVIIGGIVGLFIGFLHRTNVLILPGFGSIFTAIPLNEILVGTFLGIVIGGVIGGFFSLYTPQTNTSDKNIYNSNNNVNLQIKEEQLIIAKKWIQTGEVNIYRENFIEEKNFTVPITREELIIEKKVSPSYPSEHNVVPTETIRIVLSEEEVKFTKHKIALEDVSVYKQRIQEIKHIEETLKREKAKINVSGSPKIKEE